EGDPAPERLAALPPSTVTLVHMIHFMVQYFLLGMAGVDRAELDTPSSPRPSELSRGWRIRAGAVRSDLRAGSSAVCCFDRSSNAGRRSEARTGRLRQSFLVWPAYRCNDCVRLAVGPGVGTL